MLAEYEMEYLNINYCKVCNHIYKLDLF